MNSMHFIVKTKTATHNCVSSSHSESSVWILGVEEVCLHVGESRYTWERENKPYRRVRENELS